MAQRPLSARGWRQALSICTITLNMPQAPEGLISRKKTFCFRFWSSKLNAPGKDVLLVARQRTATPLAWKDASTVPG